MDSRKQRQEAWKAFEKRLIAEIDSTKTASPSSFFFASFNWAHVAAYAALLFILAVLLSSPAWSRSYDHNNACFDCVGNGVPRVASMGVLAGTVGALDFRLVRREAFTTTEQPVRYIIAWPHLPSVEEVQIKLAREAMAMSFQRAEEARKALQLQLDHDALVKAVALALMSVGAIITVVLGFGKMPDKRNRV